MPPTGDGGRKRASATCTEDGDPSVEGMDWFSVAGADCATEPVVV